MTPEEMSHIAGILHRQQGPVNEQALTDCIRTIQNEYQASKVTTEDDLLAVRERMKERKGMKRKVLPTKKETPRAANSLKSPAFAMFLFFAAIPTNPAFRSLLLILGFLV